MARVNKWKQFGDAFNAVYDAGTSLGSAIETGKIALKDYKDEEGQKLTGLARDRAQMDDYAAVELKYGDPMEALRMRTGVETFGQNKLKTNYETDTYDERVKQGGVLKTQDMKSVIGARGAAAGLNRANTERIGVGNKIRRGSMDSEIDANTASFGMQTARDAGLSKAYNDPSYVKSLVAEQKQTTATSTLAANTADLNNQVITNPIYQEHYVAGQLAGAARTRTMAEVDAAIAAKPETLQQAEEQLNLTLTNTMTAVNNAQTDYKLSSSEDFQANRFKTGLSNAEAASKSAEEGVILAEQSLAANTFIREWGKTANPDDPTSMRNLVAGLTRINPAVGMKLSQEYGEHELWEITNRSLRMKAETNEALQNRGAAGAQEILDKYNGDDLGIKVIKNDDGSMSMVETRAAGPGGEETEVVRTIATGQDEKEFMQDLTAALDPASLMEYSMNLVDMEYKKALTTFSNAQADAAGVGKPLSAQDAAYSTMMDPKASAADKQLATMFLFRENPELATQAMDSMQLNGLIKGGQDGGGVDDKLASSTAPVDVTGLKTAEEMATAEEVMAILALPESTADQRAEALKGSNRDLVEKYFGKDALEMEDNKSLLAVTMAKALDSGNFKPTVDGLAKLKDTFTTVSQRKPEGLSQNASNRASVNAARNVELLNTKAPEMLQILIQEISKKIIPVSRNSGAANVSKTNKNTKYAEQIEQLQALIAELTAGR